LRLGKIALSFLDGQRFVLAAVFFDNEKDKDMNLNEPTFIVELDVMSVVVGETSSTITLEGDADKYGHVFVTYVLDSGGDRTGGTYSGSARAFPDADTMVSAIFRGIWRREGGKLKIFSLDHVSTGDQNFGVIELDVLAKKASGTIYNLN
jgi:hypothetical protein